MIIDIQTAVRRFITQWVLTTQLLLLSLSVHGAEIINTGVSARVSQVAMISRPDAITSRHEQAIVQSAMPSIPKVTLGKKSSGGAAKRLAKKALTPIRATFVQLGRPLEWLNSARHHIWPSALTVSNEPYYIDRIDSNRVLDINVSPQTMFSLGSSVPALSTRVGSLAEYGLSNSYEVIASTHASATELQVRMAEDWSMLYVLDRTSTDLNGARVSVGLGLRHSF